jgi:beta-xylosidase
MKKCIFCLFLLATALFASAQQTKQEQSFITSDKGDGTYTNPFIFADVPDMSIIRVGDAYWMSSTTMHMSPGIPIMKSYDLVNWETVSYCYLALTDSDANKLSGTNQIYSNGTWASTIRYKDGVFYVTCPSPTGNSTYIFHNDDPENKPWKRFDGVSRYHDYGLLMGEDGKNWLIGGSPVNAVELKADMSGVVSGARINTGLPNLHAPDPTTGEIPKGLNEGVHVEKIGDMYYIIAITWPSGKGRTVTAHRSTNLFGGPWESKVVGQNGFRADDNGVLVSIGTGNDSPAQGSIVQDMEGNWWGYVFRDSGPVGRIPWLMPITWTDGWPMFGKDADGKGSYTNLPLGGAKPVQGKPFKSVVTSDEFYNDAKKPQYADSPKPDHVSYEAGEYDYNGSNLKMAWQWNHNPDNRYWSLTERPGWLRLKAMLNRTAEEKHILNARNTLTQRVFGPQCAAMISIDVSKMKDGDEAGLTLFAAKYGSIGIKMEGGNKFIVTTLSNEWRRGHNTNAGIESARIPLRSNILYLKAEGDFTVANNGAVNPGNFFYSYDGEKWEKLGDTLNMTYGTGNHFMGYRFGLYNFAKNAEGGYVDFDYFRIKRR